MHYLHNLSSASASSASWDPAEGLSFPDP